MSEIVRDFAIFTIGLAAFVGVVIFGAILFVVVASVMDAVKRYPRRRP